MTTDAYDAIIVWASFAGLAVARRLRGRILLLDRRSGYRMDSTGRAARGDTRVMMQRQSAVRRNADWDFHPSLTGSRRASEAGTASHRRPRVRRNDDDGSVYGPRDST